MSASPTTRPDPVAPLVQRLVASSGIIFAVLLVITILLTGGTTPDEGDPVAEWTEYARENEDNLRVGALIFGLAAYNFLLFLGFVRDAVGRAELTARGFTRAGYIVLAAGTAGIAGMAIAIGMSAAPSVRQRPTTTAATIAVAAPIANPPSASLNVNQPALQRVLRSSQTVSRIVESGGRRKKSTSARRV